MRKDFVKVEGESFIQNWLDKGYGVKNLTVGTKVYMIDMNGSYFHDARPCVVEKVTKTTIHVSNETGRSRIFYRNGNGGNWSSYKNDCGYSLIAEDRVVGFIKG